MGRLGSASAFSALLALSVIFGTQCAGEGLCGPYCSCERVEFPPMSGLFCTSAHGQSCCCDGQDPLCADNGTSVGPKCSSPEGKSICPENTGGCLAASRPLAASLGLTAQGFVKMPTLSIAGKQYNRSDLEQHFDVGTGSYIVGVKTESKAALLQTIKQEMNWEPATPFSQMMPMFAGQLDHRMIVYLLGRPDVEYVEADGEVTVARK